MPIPVVPKSNDAPEVAPTPESLLKAELALNSGNGILYAKMADGTVLPVRARGLPAGDDGTASGRDRGTFEGGCCPPPTTDDGGVVPPTWCPPPPSPPPGAPPSVLTVTAACERPGTGSGVLRINWTLSDEPGTPVVRFRVQELVAPVGSESNESAWRWADASGWVSPGLRTLAVACDYSLFDVVANEMVFSTAADVPESIRVVPLGQWRVVAVTQDGVTGECRQTASATWPGSQCCVDMPPPDFGGYVCVDAGPLDGYACNNGTCVAASGRKYEARFVFQQPDGVTVFATEEAAKANCNSAMPDAVYATQAECQAACVAGAWVCRPVTPPVSVVWYRCLNGECVPTSHAQTEIVFVPGAVANTVANGSLYRATRQQAESDCNLLYQGDYNSLSQCQAACVASKYKCVTTTTNGQTTNTCVPVADADVATALANGQKVSSSLAACQSRCGQDTCSGGVQCYSVSVQANYCDGAPNDIGTKRANVVNVLVPALLSQGWSNVKIQDAHNDNGYFCGGGYHLTTLWAECVGSADAAHAITAGGWTVNKCVSNPAP